MVNLKSIRPNCPAGFYGYDPDMVLEMEGWEFHSNGITGDMDWFAPDETRVDNHWKDVPDHVAKAVYRRHKEILDENP